MRRWLPVLLLLVPLPARAQGAAPADSTGVRPDSAAAAPAAAPAPTRAMRASWLSDRLPLRAGDLVTIVVNEQTAAAEHVSNVVTGNRAQRADLNAGVGSDVIVGPQKSFATGLNSSSTDVGDAGRSANLTAVMTVRVLDIAPNGVARIAGTKKVTVDGREQEITLAGSIRAEDVDAHNRVSSDAIAEAVITYKGKKIGPRTGILGSILGILWP